MISMYRQSLEHGAGVPGRPADIGPDARRLWHSASGLPAAGPGHRLGAGGGGGGGGGGDPPPPIRPPRGGAGGGASAAGLLDGEHGAEGGDIDAA